MLIWWLCLFRLFFECVGCLLTCWLLPVVGFLFALCDCCLDLKLAWLGLVDVCWFSCGFLVFGEERLVGLFGVACFCFTGVWSYFDW